MIHFALLIISFVVIAWAAMIVVPLVVAAVGFVLCGVFAICAAPFALLQEWTERTENRRREN